MNGTDASETVVPRSRIKLILAAALVVLLLLAIFIPPLINLGKYRRSITTSISAALGRPVEVGAMQLRLLPMPGIEFTGFTVAEDPDFGYEPALQAASVVASLRLTSLWRGKLEVSRISLDEASLNLVRNDAGQWNIGSVLLRASQITNEATAQRHAGARPRFPYIEATNARINFKEGMEKRPFSLMNAEFAMWQASGGEWQIRLKAQPVRTDLELHLSDTGVLSVEGSLRRASDLHAMPVDLQAEWSGAQLGQASRLLFGNDSGWRGDLDATAAIKGNAGDLALKTRVRISDLRRQEFQPLAPLNIDATCQSRYQHAQRSLTGLTCFLPEGQGHFLLTGFIRNTAAPASDLQLEINQIPAELPVAFLGLMRPKADNVTATGAISGTLHWVHGPQNTLTGEAAATDVTVKYPGGTLALPTLRFSTPPAPSNPRKPRTPRPVAAPPTPPAPSVLILHPVPLEMGAANPLLMDARIARAGFALHFTGAAATDRLVTAATNLGLVGNAVEGVRGTAPADLDVTTTGSWIPSSVGVSGLTAAGTIHLQNVQLLPSFLTAPVEIASAQIDFEPASIAWQNVQLRYQDLAMRGSLQFPTACAQATPCPASFTLEPGEMDAAMIESMIAGKRPGFLGQMLADLGAFQTTLWPAMHGTVQWTTLNLERLPLHNATAVIDVAGTQLTLDSLDAAALGGAIHAGGSMIVASGQPHWNLKLNVAGVKLNDAAQLFHERWGAGTASGDLQLQLSGVQAADLLSSASGSFRVAWMNGGLAAPSSSPLARFDRWTASGTIANQTATFTTATLARGANAIPLKGAIGFDRRLDLTLQTRSGPVRIAGTLAHPSPAP